MPEVSLHRQKRSRAFVRRPCIAFPQTMDCISPVIQSSTLRRLYKCPVHRRPMQPRTTADYRTACRTQRIVVPEVVPVRQQPSDCRSCRFCQFDRTPLLCFIFVERYGVLSAPLSDRRPQNIVHTVSGLPEQIAQYRHTRIEPPSDRGIVIRRNPLILSFHHAAHYNTNVCSCQALDFSVEIRSIHATFKNLLRRSRPPANPVSAPFVAALGCAVCPSAVRDPTACDTFSGIPRGCPKRNLRPG